MLHNEARKLVLEAWDKTHNAKEIAKYFSVNQSTIYRLVEERARTGSYETRTQLRGRKPILTEKQHQDILEGYTYKKKSLHAKEQERPRCAGKAQRMDRKHI